MALSQNIQSLYPNKPTTNNDWADFVDVKLQTAADACAEAKKNTSESTPPDTKKPQHLCRGLLNNGARGRI
ncbi:MAG: hypothetical protein COB46_02830 [Rhodospirillaceae bacterium]|nr:MAG: hypothetical protein COB46_02830 [Rhodospirillaceae bacterium]